MSSIIALTASIAPTARAKSPPCDPAKFGLWHCVPRQRIAPEHESPSSSTITGMFDCFVSPQS